MVSMFRGGALQVQAELIRSLRWGAEVGGRERQHARTPKTAATAGELEAGTQQLREWTHAAHAGAETRVVVAPAAERLHDGHHVPCAIGIVLRQPFAEEILHLVRKSQHD